LWAAVTRYCVLYEPVSSWWYLAAEASHQSPVSLGELQPVSCRINFGKSTQYIELDVVPSFGGDYLLFLYLLA
jgi:hypothetical protein